jgi:hypothetical protein
MVRSRSHGSQPTVAQHDPLPRLRRLSPFGGSATRPTPLRHAYDATTLAAIETDQTLDTVFATLTGRMIAVAIANNGKPIGVLKRSDLLEYLAHQRRNSSR